MCEAHGHHKVDLYYVTVTGRISSFFWIIVDSVNETPTDFVVKFRDRQILLRNNSGSMKLGENNFYGFISRSNGVNANGDVYFDDLPEI